MTKIKKIFCIILIILVCPLKANAEIKDGLLFSVGSKAITKSDILNEVKILLILNDKSYSDEIRDQLRHTAIQSIIKRSIKKIEIEKNDFLNFKKEDYNHEIETLAKRINIDVETLKNICASNGLDFLLIENQIKTELLWNSLIFYLYKDRLTVNVDEIDEQLKSIQKKKEVEEYLISEIIINLVEKNEMDSTIKELKKKITNEGFEKVAMNSSISGTAIKGGDLGWINENSISKKFRIKIMGTPVGELSEPILLPEGILIFKVRDKRKTKKRSEEEVKQQLLNYEKTKMLNLYSLTHYDKLRRLIPVKFTDE